MFRGQKNLPNKLIERIDDKENKCLSANGAISFLAWGNTPGIQFRLKHRALKARFTSSVVSIMIDAMPQSLSRVILHVIFSTKNREPWLEPDVRPRMHAYLATVCRDLGADIVRVGGVTDHVHMVTTLPRTLSQSELIEQIKKTSSKWFKALDARYRGFFWQRGYGAFSVSQSQLDEVLAYVQGQQEHHRTRTFQEEYRELLHRHGIDFDERYVWD